MPSSWQEFVEIVRKLRGPNGCPWDREQTVTSLRPFVVEEAYEVVDAIEAAAWDKLEEELGDLLLQVVLHAVIAEEKGRFTPGGVVQKVAEKMVRRHPHVFGNVGVSGSREVLANWEQIKRQERALAYPDEGASSLMSDIPPGLPALMRAMKVQNRAARVGFDWPDVGGPLEKLREEFDELEQAYREKNPDRLEEEMGDLFFALVNVARFLKVDPEIALNGTVKKFIRRFQYIEGQAAREGQDLKDLALEQMDSWWEEAKKRGI